MIPNLTIGDLTIDCANAELSRDFYADFMGWEKITAFNNIALRTDNGLTILFSSIDVPYVAPIWPEEPNKQQKQMHLDFLVDDISSTVEKPITLGATRANAQYGGDECVTMVDPEGRPFCLCKRPETNAF